MSGRYSSNQDKIKLSRPQTTSASAAVKKKLNTKQRKETSIHISGANGVTSNSTKSSLVAPPSFTGHHSHHPSSINHLKEKSLNSHQNK